MSVFTEAGRKRLVKASCRKVTKEGTEQVSPKVANAAQQIKDTADSLRLAVKQNDDTRALHDFAMIVKATANGLKAFGWGTEARPLVALGSKLMQAAKDQGLGDR